MEKTVSVIVPVYRTGRWLEQCVNSIVNQTYRKLEIILVDDGSPDECPALCDSWAEKDARIRVLHKKNGGLMAAWMDGVRLSTGEYLCFADSDDWMDTRMIEQLMKLTSGLDKEAVCGNYVQEWEGRNGKSYSVPVCQALAPGTYEGERLLKEVYPILVGQEKRPITLSRCMKLFSRQLFLNNMHYCNPEIKMGEDTNITIPALLDAKRIVIAQESYYYHYRYLQESMAHRYDPKLYENICLLSDTIRQILEDKKAPDAEGQSGREYQLLLFLVLKNEARGGRKGWIKRVRDICLLPAVKMEAAEHPLKPGTTVNRILYHILKRPNKRNLMFLQIILHLYDWRKK